MALLSLEAALWVPLHRMAPGRLRPARLCWLSVAWWVSPHQDCPPRGSESHSLAEHSQLPPAPPQMALYFCSGMLQEQAQFRHYALNVPLYTHFTSPIRRFADVLVHRLLAATLGEGRSLSQCRPVPS